MFCVKCGNQIQEGAAFCGNCGNKVGEIPEVVNPVSAEETVPVENIEESAKKPKASKRN